LRDIDMFNVSSSFQYNLDQPLSQPVRLFLIGTSDYSDRVTKWPKISRSTGEIKSISINIPLANTDGIFNTFYNQSYEMETECSVKLGFGSTEYLTLYKGGMYGVRYPDEGTCEIKLRDKFWNMKNITIGTRDEPVVFSGSLLSDITWTLCTCYGGLSGIQSSANPDIYYPYFQTWAAQFSYSDILCSARYAGIKWSDAIKSIAEYTDSLVWVDSENRIAWQRWEATPGSLDPLIIQSKIKSIGIDVENTTLCNELSVDFNYSVTSDYWIDRVTAVYTDSVNSYGEYKGLLQDETVWYISSASALNVAYRKAIISQFPPVQLTLGSTFVSLERDISDTIRMTNSFYNITSADRWRITGVDYNLQDGAIDLICDKALAYSGNAFMLDSSLLDGPDILY
jgi:hypothetical protein